MMKMISRRGLRAGLVLCLLTAAVVLLGMFPQLLNNGLAAVVEPLFG